MRSILMFVAAQSRCSSNQLVQLLEQLLLRLLPIGAAAYLGPLVLG
jgi:hypothetical protein